MRNKTLMLTASYHPIGLLSPFPLITLPFLTPLSSPSFFPRFLRDSRKFHRDKHILAVRDIFISQVSLPTIPFILPLRLKAQTFVKASNRHRIDENTVHSSFTQILHCFHNES